MGTGAGGRLKRQGVRGAAQGPRKGRANRTAQGPGKSERAALGAGCIYNARGVKGTKRNAKGQSGKMSGGSKRITSINT